MIRPLRARHFWMAILLAVIVPALILMALSARRPFPAGPLPPPLTTEPRP